MESIFLSTSKQNYLTIAKLIPIGTTNRHGLMPFFSKTPKEVIPGYFILIPRSILQNYQTSSVNGGITLVASLISFTHILWLKMLPTFQTEFQGYRERRNFPQYLCFVLNSLCHRCAHGTLTTTIKIPM
jgi:hypothetical protein